MRQFYLLQKGQAVPDQLTWSHYIELLPIKDINKINYYIKIKKYHIENLEKELYQMNMKD